MKDYPTIEVDGVVYGPAMIRQMQEDVQLYRAINDACVRLPEGWTIELTIEEGFAGPKLYSPSYDFITPQHDDCDASLADQIKELVEVAIQNTPA